MQRHLQLEDQTIVLPSNINMTEIPSNIFAYGKKLTSIDIPKSVTNIRSDAFTSCSKLTTVNYSGTMDEWKKINIEGGNDYLSYARIVCTDGVIENND